MSHFDEIYCSNTEAIESNTVILLLSSSHSGAFVLQAEHCTLRIDDECNVLIV